jgi:hypothetical protein
MKRLLIIFFTLILCAVLSPAPPRTAYAQQEIVPIEAEHDPQTETVFTCHWETVCECSWQRKEYMCFISCRLVCG